MQAILQTCVAIEERVGAIYAAFAEAALGGPELGGIWREMADDEARHAYRIRLVADRLALAGVRDPGLDAAAAQALLDRAGELLDDAIAGRLSVSEAIYAAVELEDAFLQAHLGLADDGRHPDLQTMFKSLAEEDRRHTQRLKAYLERTPEGEGLVFGDPEVP